MLRLWFRVVLVVAVFLVVMDGFVLGWVCFDVVCTGGVMLVAKVGWLWVSGPSCGVHCDVV